MIKESKGIDYVLLIVEILDKYGKCDSKKIYEHAKAVQDDTSLTYIQKILQRMVQAQLISSSTSTGYELLEPACQLTADKILNICEMPREARVNKLCQMIKRLASTISINEI